MVDEALRQGICLTWGVVQVECFTVVFIDLQSSSAAPAKRAALQDKLINLRDRLNSTYADSLAAAFQVVWGDELKAVFHHTDQLWDLYRNSYSTMKGVPFRFAVGFGSIDTGWPPHDPVDINMLDGAAFKSARLAMDTLKTHSRHPYQVWFHSMGNQNYITALNSYLGVLNDIVQHMTPAQKRHFQVEFSWNAQSDNAAGEPTSRQAVWETLQRARIDAYRAAHTGIEALLALGTECTALLLPGGSRTWLSS